MVKNQPSVTVTLGWSETNPDNAFTQTNTEPPIPCDQADVCKLLALFQQAADVNITKLGATTYLVTPGSTT